MILFGNREILSNCWENFVGSRYDSCRQSSISVSVPSALPDRGALPVVPRLCDYFLISGKGLFRCNVMGKFFLVSDS